MKSPTLRSALAVVCAIVITVCAILVFARVVGRARVADLTEHSLYTLSEGTRSILGKLNQPVKLRLYYSRTAARKGPEQIRFWNNYYLYVRDLLSEYADRSGGKLSLEIIDPRPYSEEEEEAIRYGVRRFQLSADEAFFFGLVATTELGKDEVIGFFEPDRQEFVEYDVSKLLVALMQRKKRKIGVIANAPIMGTDMSPYMMQMLRMQGRQPEKPWTIVGHIEQNYEMAKVEIKDDDPVIEDDVDFLMVIHPKNLDEKTRFAIDQYVMRGGKAMIFVDPHCLQDRPMRPQNQFQAMQHKAASDLNDLLETWGVRLEPEKIAVDRTLAVPVPLRPNAPPAKFPPYLSLRAANMSKEEVITADLHSLRMLYAGALTKIDGTGTEVRPLLETSSVGNTWKPSSPFELQMPDPATINKAVTDGTEPLMLACIITGKLKTNFPDGFEVEVDEEEEEKDEDKDKEEDEEEASEDEKKDDEKKAEDKTEAEKDDGKAGDDGKDAAKKDDDADKGKGEAGKKSKAAKSDKPATAAAGDKGEAGEKGKAAKTDKPAKPSTDGPAKPSTDKPAKPSTDKPADKGDEEKEEDKEPEKKMRKIEPVTEAAEGATVIVVADVDMLTDMLAYERSFFGMALSGDNASFVFNTLDYLSGSDDLIGIRSRGRYSRPFKVVDAIEQEAEQATATEVKAINDKIQKFEKDLRELRGKAADREDVKLIQKTAMAKAEKIDAQIRTAKKELRRLQAKRREKVEALALKVKLLNLTIAPAAILIIAVVLAVVRWIRAKHYAAQRT